MKIMCFLILFLFYASVGQANPLESDQQALGPNLPPLGRSLFDQIIAKWQAEGKYDEKLPYPFEELIAAIAKEDNTSMPTGVLIPRGRSLQKDAARPNYFSFPRVVVAFGAKDQGIREIPALKLQNRLFIGYVESAERLEVISYNDEMGRFEFQVVTNYGGTKLKPTPAKVYQAERSVCMTCHKGQMPIFPKDPWSETNGNSAVSANISAAMGGKSVYQGVAIYDDALINARIVDDAVSQASILSYRKYFWQDGCGNEKSLAATECRAAFLRFGLLKSAQSNTDYAEKKLDLEKISVIEQRLSAPKFGSYSVFSSGFDALPIPFFVGFEVGEQTEQQKEKIAQAKQVVSGFLVPYGGDLDVSSRKPVYSGLYFDLDDVVTSFRDNAMRNIYYAVGNNERRIADSITSLLAKYKRGETSIFDPKPFVRSVVLDELLREAGIKDSKFCCENKKLEFPFEPELEPTASIASPVDSKHEIIGLLKEFCGGCHINKEGIPAFLVGTDDEILLRFKADNDLVDQMMERLETGSMPPKGTIERSKLSEPKNVEKRNALKLLPKFIEEH